LSIASLIFGNVSILALGESPECLSAQRLAESLVLRLRGRLIPMTYIAFPQPLIDLNPTSGIQVFRSVLVRLNQPEVT